MAGRFTRAFEQFLINQWAEWLCNRPLYKVYPSCLPHIDLQEWRHERFSRPSRCIASGTAGHVHRAFVGIRVLLRVTRTSFNTLFAILDHTPTKDNPMIPSPTTPHAILTQWQANIARLMDQLATYDINMTAMTAAHRQHRDALLADKDRLGHAAATALRPYAENLDIAAHWTVLKGYLPPTSTARQTDGNTRCAA